MLGFRCKIFNHLVINKILRLWKAFTTFTLVKKDDNVLKLNK